MADIKLPPGAFAAAKSGQPQPRPAAEGGAKPEATAKAPPAPKPAPAAKEPEAKADAGGDPTNGMTPAEKKIWKLKVEGEEFEFDATDEEAVKREIMRARGADKRFKSAAQMREQAEKFFEMIKNPQTLKQVLSDPRIGVDVRKWAEEQVWEAIQQQQREAEWEKNPAAKEQWEKEQRLKAYEEKEAREKESADAAQRQKEVARYEQDYSTKIMSALERGGIPKTERAVARMGEYLMQAVQHGYDLTADDLVEQVKKDYLDDFAAVLGGADGEQLLQILGEANAKKLREADLKRLKSPQSNPFPGRSPAKKAAEGKGEPPPKRLSGSAWKDDLIKGFLTRQK